MTLNDNKTDYIHWNISNEIMDRLRFKASLQASHDNEIPFIIKELREVWL